MRFFANENLFEPIIEYLKNIGNDVLSIRDAGLSGISDDEVFQIACKEKRIIITMDKDFARMLRFPPEKCGGIIVVKIYKHTVDETLDIFKKLFASIQEKYVHEKLTIVTPEGIRSRKPR